MKNKKLYLYLIYVAFALASLATLITFLILFIKSREVYSDEAGTDLAFNYNYAIGIIVSLFVNSYYTYKIHMIFHHNEIIDRNEEIALTCFLLISNYSLGYFFKKLFKGPIENFNFGKYQMYLYVGIVALILTIIAVILTIKKIQKRKAKKEDNK